MAENPKETFMTGVPYAGISESRASTKPLPDLPAVVIVDQLAACGHDPHDESLLLRVEASLSEERKQPLWAPRRP